MRSRKPFRERSEKTKTQREVNEVYAKMSPDEVAFTRRMIDLATSAPKDPAARDALIWVINKPGMLDVGAYGDEFARAAALLVRHHGDDPEAVRVGLGLDNIVSQHRDALFSGFYAAAKCREAKGLARLALAQYLEETAKFAAGTREVQERKRIATTGSSAMTARRTTRRWNSPTRSTPTSSSFACATPTRSDALAERLYSEVIAEYRDVVHRTVKSRELEDLFNESRTAVERQAADAGRTWQTQGACRKQADARRRSRGAARRNAQPDRGQAGSRDRRRRF